MLFVLAALVEFVRGCAFFACGAMEETPATAKSDAAAGEEEEEDALDCLLRDAFLLIVS